MTIFTTCESATLTTFSMCKDKARKVTLSLSLPSLPLSPPPPPPPPPHLSPVIAEDPETRQYILDLRGQYGQSQEINLEEMESSGEICRRPRRMSVKRTRQQDKEGLAKQSAQAEAELRKKSLAAEVNLHSILSERIAHSCTCPSGSAFCWVDIGLPEQVLGWFPLGLGLVMEDRSTELSCMYSWRNVVYLHNVMHLVIVFYMFA